MAIRYKSFTLKLDDLELAALDNLIISCGAPDRASILRALIWSASRERGILTDGDIRELSRQEPRGRKPPEKRSV